MLGERLLSLPDDMGGFSSPYSWCNNNVTGDLWHRYCTNTSEVADMSSCDSYFIENEARVLDGIPGMASGVIKSKSFLF